MAGMTDEEKFEFDLGGFLVIPGVLNDTEVVELNTLSDEAWPGEHDETGLRTTAAVSRWGPRFRDLIDHPRITPYLVDLMGPKFRIDHDYSIFMNRGTSALTLHGGPSPQYEIGGDHWYRYFEGTIRNGLTVFTYCLSDTGPGDGGFVCVPGSHKTNLLSNLPKDIAFFERPAYYVHQPVAKAGDVIIFTEALIHGTLPWSADHERRSLLYKYSPGHSSWSGTYYDPADYPGATQQQIRIMAPPSVGERPDSIQAS